MHNPAVLKLIFLEHDGDTERMKGTLRTLGVVPAHAAQALVRSLTSTTSDPAAPSNYWVTLAGQIASARSARGVPMTVQNSEPAGGGTDASASRGFTVRIHSRISLMEPMRGLPAQGLP